MISSIKQNFSNFFKRWKFIFLGIIIMLFLGTVYSYSVFRVALENHFKIGSALSGIPYMVALVFYALFMLLAGKRIERYKPATSIIFGGLLVALGWVFSSLAPNIFVLAFTYGVVGGAGVGIAYGALMNVAAKWFPDKKGFAVGLVLIGFGLSPLITAPIAGNLVLNHGVMKTFLILGATFFILLPALAIWFRYPKNEEVAEYSKNMKLTENSLEISLDEMIKTKSFKGVYSTFVIGTMIGLMLIGMTTSVGVDLFEIDTTTVTKYIIIFAIANGAGRPVFGWVTDRFSPQIAIFASYTLIIFSAILIIIFNDFLPVYIISFSVFWFNLGGWLAIAPTTTLKLYGIKHYSENYGLIFTAYGIGAVVGVLSSGAILDLLGNYDYVFYYIIVLCVVGLILTNKLIKGKIYSD